MIIRLLVLMAGFALTACHPSYTVEQSEKFARKLGVTNQMEISRWNNRVISQKSALVLATTNIKVWEKTVEEEVVREVVAQATDEEVKGDSPATYTETITRIVTPDVSSTDLLAIAYRALNAHFAQVSVVEGEYGLSDAMQKASFLGTGFLVYLQLQQLPDASLERQRWILDVTIVDAISGHVFDKAEITVTAAMPPSLRVEDLALLEKPLEILAKDLSGE